MRAFLLETSVLDRLSGELCDAVTGRTGSQALLEQVERAGLFLVPLDEVRGWWRYHHLFADLLRARLQAEQPGQVAQLHRNAAGWYEEHGLADEAIRHAVAAGEMTSAARLIERHFDAAHSLRGEAATIQRWLAPLPADLVRSRPRLLLAQAVPAATGGHLEEAEQLIDAAELASAGTAGEPLEPTIGKAGSLLVNVPALIAIARGYLAQLRGDGPGTAEFAARGMAEISDGEWILRSVAQGQLAVADWLGGRLAGAERAFTEGIAGRRAAGLPTWSAWESYELGRVQQAQGRLDAVVLTCEQALDAIAGPARRRCRPLARRMWCWPRWPISGTSSTARCRRSPRGSRCAARSSTRCRWPRAWPRWRGYGRPLATRPARWRRWAKPSGPPPGRPGWSTPSRRSGRGCSWPRATWAGRRAGRRSPASAADDEPEFPREPGQLVLARVLLAQGRPGPALALLDRLHAAAGAEDRTGSLIEIRALRALALAAGGDEPAALDALAGALVLACPQGYVRVFADEGQPMAALLGRLVAAQRAEHAAARRVPLDCLARLQRAFDAGHAAPVPGPATAAVPGIVEPLTGRELEVLEMLAAGRSNQAIASQLFVSLDTVKKHVGHVLGKLGAANRTEAVARARQLGLIP